MNETDPVYFEIARVFEITGRGVVLVGQVRSGIVHVGMEVQLPLNSGLRLASTVKSVEFIDYSEGSSDIGLLLDEETPELRSLWMQAVGAGELICLVDARGTGMGSTQQNAS